MIESLEAPNEAFDWIWMTTERDWELLQEAWPSRSADWREACAYILGRGRTEKCVPLFHHAINDKCDDAAVQAACSLCDQILRHKDYCMLDASSLKRLTEFDRQGRFAKMPEARELLSRAANGGD